MSCLFMDEMYHNKYSMSGIPARRAASCGYRSRVSKEANYGMVGMGWSCGCDLVLVFQHGNSNRLVSIKA